MIKPEGPDKSNMPDSLKKLRDGLRGKSESDRPRSGKGLFGYKGRSSQKSSSKKSDVNRSSSDIYPVSAAKERERTRLIPCHEIGAIIEGKGVYIGVQKIMDKKEQLVGYYDLYAATEDLQKTSWLEKKALKNIRNIFKSKANDVDKDKKTPKTWLGKKAKKGAKNWLRNKKCLVSSFNEAVNEVAKLKKWQGYNGFNHKAAGKAAHEVLYDAMREGRYQGEWFIPPIAVLKEVYNNKSQAGFYETLEKEIHLDGNAHCYWSSTEDLADHRVKSIRMLSGAIDKDQQTLEQSTRCVRAEPRL